MERTAAPAQAGAAASPGAGKPALEPRRARALTIKGENQAMATPLTPWSRCKLTRPGDALTTAVTSSRKEFSVPAAVSALLARFAEIEQRALGAGLMGGPHGIDVPR